MRRAHWLAFLVVLAGCRFAPLPPGAKLPPGYHPLRPAGPERAASPQEMEEAFSRRRAELIGVLRTGSEEDRSYAREELGRMGHAAMDALGKLAREEDAEARSEAARTLGATHDAPALALLVPLLSDDDWSVREAAAEGIGRLGKRPEGEALLARLKDDAWRVRLAAIRAVGQVGETRAAEPLGALTSDVDEDVRYEAYLALSRLGQASSRGLLAKGLDAEDPNVRKACAEGLARVGDPGDIAVLEPHLRESSAEVRAEVVQAMAALGKGALPDSARAVVDGWIDSLGSQDCEAQRTARVSLGRLGRAATPFVTERLATAPPPLQSALLEVLAAEADPRVIPALEGFYPSAGDDARRGMLAVLAQLQVPEAIPLLVRIATEAASDLRIQALTQLARRGGQAAESALSKAIEDADAAVRRQAATLAVILPEESRLAAAMRALSGESDAQTRRALLSLIAGIPRKESREALVGEYRSSKDVESRRQVVRDLAATGSAELRPFFVEALFDDDATVRAGAIDGLLREGSPEVAPLLEEVLAREKDPAVRGVSLFALATVDPPRALERLRAALAAGDAAARETAVAALAKVQTPEAVHLLAGVFDKADDPLRQKAMEALCQMPANLAAPILLHAVQGDADEYLRSMCVRTLALWGYLGAAPALREQLAREDSPIVRPAIIEALGLLRDAESVGLIAQAAKDPDQRTRMGAILSLGLVGTEAAVLPLVDALQDADPFVKRSAIEALGFLHAPSAEGALVERLADPDVEVRRAAVFAVAAFRDARKTPLVIEAMRGLDPGLSGAALRLKCAEGFYQNGFPDIAKEEFENVLRLPSQGGGEDARAQSYLSMIAASEGDFSAAADHARGALMLAPNDAGAKKGTWLEAEYSILHGVAALVEGRATTSLREIELGLEKSGRNVEELNNAAYYLAEAGLQLDRAKSYAEEALQKRPEDPNLLDTAGWIAYRRDDWKGAKELLLQAVSHGATDGEVYYHLARAELALEERGAAIEHLCRAIDMSPHLGPKAQRDPFLGEVRKDPRVRRALSPAGPR